MKKHLVDPKAAEAHGIQLDERGWPMTSSLQEWHKKNNPHFFAGEEIPAPAEEGTPGFSVPLWIIPLLPIVIVVILFLK
jgi:hypothetical protein